MLRAGPTPAYTASTSFLFPPHTSQASGIPQVHTSFLSLFASLPCVSQALTQLCTQLTHGYHCCQITTPTELKPPKTTALSWPQVTLPTSEPFSTHMDLHPPQMSVFPPLYRSSGQFVGCSFCSWLQDPKIENAGSNYLLAKKAAVAVT